MRVVQRECQGHAGALAAQGPWSSATHTAASRTGQDRARMRMMLEPACAHRAKAAVVSALSRVHVPNSVSRARISTRSACSEAGSARRAQSTAGLAAAAITSKAADCACRSMECAECRRAACSSSPAFSLCCASWSVSTAPSRHSAQACAATCGDPGTKSGPVSTREGQHGAILVRKQGLSQLE